jgi:hypothetical protein
LRIAPTRTAATTITSEIDSSFAVRDTAERNRNRTIPKITALFAEARRAITRPDDEPQPRSGKRRKGEDDKEGGAFHSAAQRVTINFRGIARTFFRDAKAAIIRTMSFVRQSPATTTEEHFWFHHWQHGAAPVADAAPDCGPSNHLSLDL